ncbi:DUF2442 domain-containing protein [Microbacterium sp. H83]|uniref:DUF2442 domain-containing protein n=1 Tax=Microbacterium sp. H83 TaxID=1827324 RepID=UPI0007F37108|nr:DUF2442 domain-containing protein [Microbacterium sp. H83]OAN41229.1 hypothetical protein A4X16_12035 [Microbacterium sp. H83]
MSTPIDDALAVDLAMDDDELHVRIDDGRVVSVPLVWFPRLAGASVVDRSEWTLIGAGQGIHWPRLDEDISIAALLRER